MRATSSRPTSASRWQPPRPHRPSTGEDTIADRPARHRRLTRRRRSLAALGGCAAAVAVITAAGVGLARPTPTTPAGPSPRTASTSPSASSSAPVGAARPRAAASTPTSTTASATNAAAATPLAASPAEAVRRRLTAVLDPLVEPHDMAVTIVDHRSGAVWSTRGSEPHILASLTKLTTAVGVFLVADDDEREVTDDERDLVRRTLQVSDNDAQNALWSVIGGHDGFDRVAARLHLDATVSDREHAWGRTRSTSDDQAHLMEMLLGDTPPIDADDAAWILDTMTGVQADQTWGAAPFGAADGRVVQVKNGWSPYPDTGLWRLTSLGHIRDDDHDYTVAILSDGWSTFEEGTPRLDDVGQAVYDALSSA